MRLVLQRIREQRVTHSRGRRVRQDQRRADSSPQTDSKQASNRPSRLDSRAGTPESSPRAEPAGRRAWEGGLPVRQQVLKQSRDANQGCRLQALQPQQLVNHSTLFFMLFWQQTTCDFGAAVAGVFSQQTFTFCQDLTISTASCVFIALYKVAALQQSLNISDF